LKPHGLNSSTGRQTPAHPHKERLFNKINAVASFSERFDWQDRWQAAIASR
jgi:hypothetical protein